MLWLNNGVLRRVIHNMDIEKEIDNLLWSIDEEAPSAAAKQVKALIIRVTDEIIGEDEYCPCGGSACAISRINMEKQDMRIKRDELLK